MTFISISDFRLKRYAKTIPIGIKIVCITRYHGQHFFFTLYTSLLLAIQFCQLMFTMLKLDTNYGLH
jgi:hypothetical protein